MQEERDRNVVYKVEYSGRGYKIMQHKMVLAPKWRQHYFEFNDKIIIHNGIFTELSRLLYPCQIQAIRTCTLYLLVFV